MRIIALAKEIPNLSEETHRGIKNRAVGAAQMAPTFIASSIASDFNSILGSHVSDHVINKASKLRIKELMNNHLIISDKKIPVGPAKWNKSSETQGSAVHLLDRQIDGLINSTPDMVDNEQLKNALIEIDKHIQQYNQKVNLSVLVDTQLEADQKASKSASSLPQMQEVKSSSVRGNIVESAVANSFARQQLLSSREKWHSFKAREKKQSTNPEKVPPASETPDLIDFNTEAITLNSALLNNTTDLQSKRARDLTRAEHIAAALKNAPSVSDLPNLGTQEITSSTRRQEKNKSAILEP